MELDIDPNGGRGQLMQVIENVGTCAGERSSYLIPKDLLPLTAKMLLLLCRWDRMLLTGTHDLCSYHFESARLAILFLRSIKAWTTSFNLNHSYSHPLLDSFPRWYQKKKAELPHNRGNDRPYLIESRVRSQ